MHLWYLSHLPFHLFYSAPSGREECRCHGDNAVKISPACDSHKYRCEMMGAILSRLVCGARGSFQA